jgi:Polyketide cyclase / dehydrase and lipid transport
MARNEQLMQASPDAVFAVLADPRSYAYWVVGSREIRDADMRWPALGSHFHHTVKLGPLSLKDHSLVEDVEPGRFLQLKVKGRPLGTARVRLELDGADGGTRVTMTEDPADRFSRLMFTPLTHRLVHARNVRSLDRLAELAEGRAAIPGEEPTQSARSVYGEDTITNPASRVRRDALGDAAAAVGRGTAAGLAGALVMSVSTNAEMRLRNRAPSDAPARALGRMFGVSARGKRREMQLALAGHVATSVSIGAVRGAVGHAGVRPARAGVTLFGLALVPEIVVVPALGASAPPWRWSATDWAVTVLHHGVYAAATNATYALLEARAETSA